MDTHAPVKDCNQKQKPNCEWYNDDINMQKRIMRKYERQYFKHKSDENLKLYKKERNKLTNKIKVAKINYYNSLVHEKQGDQKALFRIMKKLLHSSKKQSLPEHSSVEILVEDFNNFFINKIKTIRNNFGESLNYDKYDIRTPPPSEMSYFNCITIEDAKKNHQTITMQIM